MIALPVVALLIVAGFIAGVLVERNNAKSLANIIAGVIAASKKL